MVILIVAVGQRSRLFQPSIYRGRSLRVQHAFDTRLSALVPSLVPPALSDRIPHRNIIKALVIGTFCVPSGLVSVVSLQGLGGKPLSN